MAWIANNWVYPKGEPLTPEEEKAQAARTREWRNKLYRGFFVHRHKYKGAKRGLGNRGLKHHEQFGPNWNRKPHRRRGRHVGQ